MSSDQPGDYTPRKYLVVVEAPRYGKPGELTRSRVGMYRTTEEADEAIRREQGHDPTYAGLLPPMPERKHFRYHIWKAEWTRVK